MNQLIETLERKYGRYAIPNLTRILIVFWIVGYVLQATNSTITTYMSLNIYAILHGQIWRLITWVMIPPSDLSIWTIIMLMFYVSIGGSLERSWGDFRYNVYVIGGVLMLLIAGFLTYFVLGAILPGTQVQIGATIGSFFSTYYIAMSLTLAFAATFPDASVLLMFIIPLKMKYLGVMYVAMMGIEAVQYISYAVRYRELLYVIPVVAIVVSLLNFFLFFFSTRRRVRLTKEQREMRRNFRANVQHQQYRATTVPAERKVQGIHPRHRCEICGKTDISNPELDFRYCTSCSGEHEYCSEHIHNHVHHEE